MNRDEAIAAIAEQILRVEREHSVRVAVDGVTASGKTTLADELARALLGQARQVIRASVDDFHNPPQMRYRRGRMSAEGYYLDTFDYASLRALLLEPLGPGGSRQYRFGAFGQPDGSDVEFEEHTADEDAFLVVDGVFLFRPEINDCWDYRVYVDVDQHTAMERGIARDASWMGGAEVARERYEERYAPGERLYLEGVRPWGMADVIVTNDEFDDVSLLVRRSVARRQAERPV